MRAPQHRYTQEELDYLREITPGNPYSDITRMFNEKFNTNISFKAISSKIKALGLKNGINGQFQKNNTPFNKGVPMTSWMTPEKMERCKATQFKKGGIGGQARTNDKAVGTERVDKYGYTEIRVDKPVRTYKYVDGHTATCCWRLKHQVIYEEYHKIKIPKGYKVMFLDGNIRNFDINNLVLVSSAELLKLNQLGLYFRNHPDLTQVGLDLVKINMEVRKKCKDQKE